MSLLDRPPPSGSPPDPSLDPSFQASLATDDELLDAIASLESMQRRLDAHRAAVLGETAARSIAERRRGLSLKAWLGHEHQISGATAARQVATARKLRLLLPEIATALADGLITFDHAVVIARLCTPRVEQIVIELQPLFIELAAATRFERWAHEVRALVSYADSDGPRPLGEPVDRLRIIDGLDGSLRIEAELHGVTAAKVRAALFEEAQRRYRAHLKAAHGHEAPGCGGTTDGTADGTGRCCEADTGLDQHPRRSELLAGALAELITRGSGARPNAPSPVTDVTLVVNASGPLDARTPDGVQLQDRTVRELLCDAVFHAVVVDQLGVPVDQGRAARLFTNEQKRNIRVRDGGCGHPGCDAPWEWVQVHHVRHWEHGGPTDQANGLPACARHHHLWHSTGWSVEPDPDTHPLDEGFVITTPDGTRLRSQRHGRPRPLVTELGLVD